MNEQPVKSAPSPHPSSCRACGGCGWVAGPVRTLHALGGVIEYPTVARCGHDWWRDEDRYEELLGFDDPRAQAAFARGYAEGVAELAARRAAIGLGPWRP